MISHFSENERKARLVLGTPRVDPIVLFPATEGMMWRIEKCFCKKTRSGQITRLRSGDQQVSLCRSGIGAPSTEIVLRALLAAGAKMVLRFDVCGSLTPELPVGSLFLAEKALSRDGVSAQYCQSTEIMADSSLVSAARDVSRLLALPLCSGTITTVDFFFAQTVDHHREWAGSAQAVDMETAAIYAMCSADKAKAVSIMTVSDLKLCNQDPFSSDNYDYASYRAGLTNLSRFIPELLRQIQSTLPD